MDFIESDAEFCKNIFVRAGSRQRIAQKWLDAVNILNKFPAHFGGVKKDLPGWKSVSILHCYALLFIIIHHNIRYTTAFHFLFCAGLERFEV